MANVLGRDKDQSDPGKKLAASPRSGMFPKQVTMVDLSPLEECVSAELIYLYARRFVRCAGRIYSNDMDTTRCWLFMRLVTIPTIPVTLRLFPAGSSMLHEILCNLGNVFLNQRRRKS